MTKLLARRPWVAMFVAISLVLAVTGYGYYRAEAAEIDQADSESLAAIGDLKAQQIAQWRKERLLDAAALADGFFLQEHFVPVAGRPLAPALQTELRAYLGRRAAGYEGALLATPDGVVIVSTAGTAGALVPDTMRTVSAALATHEAVLSTFHREAGGPAHIDAVAAVRTAAGAPVAVAILRSNARDYLFPLIQSWPTPSATSETLVVQRDGDEVVFLNGLRHQPEGTILLRRPLTASAMPAVRAVLGEHGRMTGVDYRGVPVVADVRPIPGSPWFLVAKVDAEEILAKARSRALAIGLVVSSLILLAAAATAWLYRQRQAGLYRDLYESERRRRESVSETSEALRQSVERFELAARASFSVIWEYDPRSNSLWRSGSFEAFGHQSDEVKPGFDAWLHYIHPDDHDRVKAGVTAACAGRADSWSDSYRFRRKDGSYAAIEDRGHIARDAEGRPLRMVGAMHDVSQRDETLDMLCLQGAALNAAANAIVIADHAGSIVWVNSAFTRLTGYSAEEAVGRNPRELIKSGAHDRSLYEDMWNTVLSGQIWRGEMTNRRKNGTLYSERQTITPVRGPAGTITHFIAIKQDLTDEKRLEAQFLQSQKMEVVGRLAGGIAHDFNNLLTVINMTADLAAENLRAGDPLREDLSEIAKAGARAAGLTRQLLAFSRKQIMKPDVLDPGVLVQGMQGMLQRLIGEQIELVVTPAKAGGRIKADAGQIEQVIMNLAVNARDAMPDGGVLTIETHDVTIDEAYRADHPGTQAGPHVMFAVSDTGTGMDAETRGRIFEPFFSTKGPGRGTGLGLSTVYGIVKQSGGSVWVYSEPGLGTTFKIYLPRVLDPVTPDVPVGQPAISSGSETILIVEDEPALRQLATRMLRSAGYDVLSAGNGGEALLTLENHPARVHLMLTDVVMPGLSGRELATRLKTIRPDMKVLFTSGYTDDAILRHGVLDDVAHFVGKPFTKADLTRRVRMELDAGRAEPPPSAPQS